MSRTRRRQRLGHIALAALVVSSGVILTAGTAAAVAGTPANGRILHQDAAGAVRDSYIVVLRSGASVATTAGQLTRRYGGAVRRSYTSAVRGFNVRMSATAARRLAANPAVAYVEQDRMVTLEATQSDPTWGLDRIDQRDLPLSRTYTAPSAAGVTAYVLDSGIRISHADFEGRARHGYDFIGSDAVAEDCNGHGTHVAGTIGGRDHGVAKDIRLVGVRVLNCEGSGSYSQIIAGVDWVTRNAVKPAVANMSLGGPSSAALDDAVRRSIASGVTYALAAGNDNTNACNKSPARTAEGITVGASDGVDARASFSNYGSCLDTFAPGVKIRSAGKGSDTAVVSMSGTSMAAPHVAGAAALVLGGTPDATTAQVRDILVARSTVGAVTGRGTGSPNRLLFTGTDAVPAPEPVPTSTPTTAPTTAPTAAPTTAPTTAPTAAPTTAPATSPITAPTAAPVPCGPFTSTTNLVIFDRATVTGSRRVTGCAGDASATSTVDVAIKHGHRGSLLVTLIGPDGTAYPLKATTSGDSGNDLAARYVLDASASPRNGTWRLEVRDTAKRDIGYLDAWTLRL